MKKFFIIILVILCVTIGAGLFFINPILERAKPSLLSSIQGSLGAPLDISKIEVSIFPSPGFILKGIATGKDKLENEIEEAKLFVSLPSLLSGNIEIASFSITGGKLKAIKTKSGKFVFLKEEKEEAQAVPVKQDEHSAPLDSSATGTTPKNSKLPIRISDAKVDRVSFEIFDELLQSSIVIDNLNANASEDGADTVIQSKITSGKDEVNLSAKLIESDLDRINADVEFNLLDINRWVNTFVKDPIPAKLEGGLKGKLKFTKEGLNNSVSDINLDLSPLGITFKEFLDKKVGETLNISLQSILLGSNIDLGTLIIKLSGVDFLAKNIVFNPVAKTINQNGVDASINLDALKSSSPILTQYPVVGDLSLKSAEENALTFDFKGKFNSEGLEAHGLLKKFNGDIEVNPLTIKIGASGRLDLSFMQSVGGMKNIDLKLQNSQIKDLLAFSEGTKKLPLSGVVKTAQAKLNGDKVLSGPFDVGLTDFTIIGFNLFAKVASALDQIPGMKEALTTSLPDSYRVILLGENSNFSSITMNGSLAGPNVTVPRLYAQSKGYHVEGKGGMNSGALDFDIDLVIEKELVSLLEARSKDIGKIKSLDGTILIPVTISKSKDGTPLVYPNLEKLLKSQASAQVREVGKKALDKVAPGLGSVVEGFLGN